MFKLIALLNLSAFLLFPMTSSYEVNQEELYGKYTYELPGGEVTQGSVTYFKPDFTSTLSNKKNHSFTQKTTYRGKTTWIGIWRLSGDTLFLSSPPRAERARKDTLMVSNGALTDRKGRVFKKDLAQ